MAIKTVLCLLFLSVLFCNLNAHVTNHENLATKKIQNTCIQLTYLYQFSYLAYLQGFQYQLVVFLCPSNSHM